MGGVLLCPTLPGLRRLFLYAGGEGVGAGMACRGGLSSRAEATRSTLADLALVLGTSGGGWEGRASRLNVDWLRGRGRRGLSEGRGSLAPLKP